MTVRCHRIRIALGSRRDTLTARRDHSTIWDCFDSICAPKVGIADIFVLKQSEIAIIDKRWSQIRRVYVRGKMKGAQS